MENTINKQSLAFVAPAGTVSGYGSRSRDLVRALIALDKYDIKIVSTRWGSTPLNALIAGKDDDIINRLVPQLTEQPDIFIQVSVPNEFQPIGKYNIGITAGIETTLCASQWLEGANKMNLIVVPSEHSKNVFLNSKYDMMDSQTNQKAGELKFEKEIEVLFEGIDLTVFKKTDELDKTIVEELSSIPEKFCYLFVGHWMQGVIGEDRKNVGMLIRSFLEAFKNVTDAPALILKTSGGTFSHMDRLEIERKIEFIKTQVDARRLPNIYVLHGDLTESEMNSLYMHPKVKAHVSLTKGEGYGRPLAEAAISGKPVIATNWSGHIDFLNPEYVTLIPGQLTNVHESAAWENVILKESQWFTADYNYFIGVLKDVYKNYDSYLEKSRKMTKHIKDNFSWELMKTKLDTILQRVPEFPKMQKLVLPKLKKIELPKLEKVEE